MVHTLADDFAQEVARLCCVEVTQSRWEAFLDAHIPRVHTTTGLPLTGRSQTMADTKRTASPRSTGPTPECRPGPALPTASYRPSPPASTTTEGVVRGGSRAERNSLKTITGDFGRLDRQSWHTLQPLLVTACWQAGQTTEDESAGRPTPDPMDGCLCAQ